MPAGEPDRNAAVSGYHDEDGTQGLTGMLAQLSLAVGQLTQTLAAPPKPADPKIPWDACHPVWFTGSIPLAAGAGTLNQAALYGPELPYWWDLRSLRTWGFTAGTVVVYRNLVGGEQVGTATSPGEFTWSGQEFLSPQDSLVFVASGVTGTVSLAGWAVEVASGWLPEYLM